MPSARSRCFPPGVASTASEYEGVQQKLRTLLSGAMSGVLADDTTYLFQWVLRGVQMAEGSLQKLGPLVVAKNFDLARFAELFPGHEPALGAVRQAPGLADCRGLG